MTDDLLKTLREVCGKLAATPHDPVLARGGRCNCLVCRSERLAARGWPSSTMGDETGIRSRNTSSSTERAAATRDPFATLNERLAVHLGQLRADALAIIAIAGIIDSHAGDDDPLPAGAGGCQRCPHTCNSRKRGPNDRLRSGWCPACHRRFLRLRDRLGYAPDRNWFNKATDEELAAYEPTTSEVA